jgi:hypothetical protein
LRETLEPLAGLAYFVVQSGAGIPLKFTVIAAGAFVLTVALYEVAVRRWNPVRFLFGMKPRRAVGTVPSLGLGLESEKPTA